MWIKHTPFIIEDYFSHITLNSNALPAVSLLSESNLWESSIWHDEENASSGARRHANAVGFSVLLDNDFNLCYRR